VYELLTHAGGVVHVLEAAPVALETANWKQSALDWFYVPGALSMPVVLVPPGGPMPPDMPRITEAEFQTRLHQPFARSTPNTQRPATNRQHIAISTSNNQRPTTNIQPTTVRASSGDGGPHSPDPRPSTINPSPLTMPPPLPSAFHLPPSTLHLPSSTLPLTPVRWESVTDDRIEFVAAAVGRPHLIKMNWFPNWRVRGAEAVYRVTPDFMLVIPRQPRVELYYGLTATDRFGLTLTALGWGIIGAIALWRVRPARRQPAV
jgi:hypothetical protein